MDPRPLRVNPYIQTHVLMISTMFEFFLVNHHVPDSRVSHHQSPAFSASQRGIQPNTVPPHPASQGVYQCG